MSFYRSVAQVAALGIIGLATTASAGECSLKRLASIPVTVSAGGSILMDVSIEQQPEQMMLDTGAGISMLARAFVERQNLPSVDSPIYAYGLTGKQLRQATRVRQFAIGKLITPGATFLVGDVGGDGANRQPVGIIGADFFSSRDVEIDSVGGRVNIFAPDHCRGNVVYWAKEYFRVPIQLTADGRIDIEIGVDGKTLHALVDTGAGTTTMRLAVARAAFDISPSAADQRADRSASGVDGVRVKSFPYIFGKLTMGGITLNNTSMMISDIDSQKGLVTTGSRITGNPDQEQVIIGMSLLRRLHLFIAYSEPALYFTVADTTEQVVGRRRLAVLRDLGTLAGRGRSVAEI